MNIVYENAMNNTHTDWFRIFLSSVRAAAVVVAQPTNSSKKYQPNNINGHYYCLDSCTYYAVVNRYNRLNING